MKTVCLQIGNSDDKLTQKLWSEFVEEVDKIIYSDAYSVHFAAGSSSTSQWQNHAWVFVIEEDMIVSIQKKLLRTKDRYGQNSIAWMEGETEFIT